MKSRSASEPLERLQRWYHSNCNDDWEHSYGVMIETLDNPGWRLVINLEQTGKADQSFKTIDTINIDDENDEEWIFIEKENNQLKGACGPMQLNNLMSLVADWLEK